MSVAHALVSRLRASSASRVQTGEAPAQATALLKSLEAAHALTENLRAQRRGKEMRDVNRKLRSKHGTVFLVDPFQRPAVARPKTARGRWRRAIGKVQTMHRWKKVLHRGTPVSKALAGQPAAAGDTDDEAEATGVATTAHVSSALTNDALSMLESMTAAHAVAHAEGETTGDAAVRRNGKDAVPSAEASLAAVMVESGAVRTMASLLRQPSGDTAARAMRVFSEAARLGVHSVETLDDAGAATGNVVVKAPVLEAMIQQGVAPAIAEGLDAHATSREYTSQAFAFLADAATMPGRDITSLGLTLGSLRSIQAAHKYVGVCRCLLAIAACVVSHHVPFPGSLRRPHRDHDSTLMGKNSSSLSLRCMLKPVALVSAENLPRPSPTSKIALSSASPVDLMASCALASPLWACYLKHRSSTSACAVHLLQPMRRRGR